MEDTNHGDIGHLERIFRGWMFRVWLIIILPEAMASMSFGKDQHTTYTGEAIKRRIDRNNTLWEEHNWYVFLHPVPTVSRGQQFGPFLYPAEATSFYLFTGPANSYE